MVVDHTGLVSSGVIAAIDARNEQLYGATGRVVVVEVSPGGGGQTAYGEGIETADSVAKDRYGAIVWMATTGPQTDIIFVGRAATWIPYDQQVALRHDFAAGARSCCPGDAVAPIVNRIADAMVVGSKVAPDPSNYVRDRLGELDAEQTATIISRDERLEAGTGKGIAVVLMPEQQDAASGVRAVEIAQTLNVKGRIAAVVWVDRSQNASHFSIVQTPGFDTIPQSSLDQISASFQADMQTGSFGDAIVAAVDRTATALEATSTPMPTLAPEPEEAVPEIPAGPTPPGVSLLRSFAPKGVSGTGTVIAIFVAFAIVVVFVTLALRRERQT